MTENLRLVIPMLPPVEFSPNSRVHWSDRYAAGETFGTAVWATCRNEINTRYRNTPWHPFERVTVWLTVVVKEKRRRDDDNFRIRFKPGQDALVQAELVPDDTPDRLKIGADIKVLVDPERAPMTIIDIEGERD